MILVQGSGWNQTFPNSTSVDTDTVNGFSGSSMVQYVLWAQPPVDGRHGLSVYQQLMGSVIYGCLRPGNDCFSGPALGLLCSVHQITGVNPGATSIGDGGNDMCESPHVDTDLESPFILDFSWCSHREFTALLSVL